MSIWIISKKMQTCNHAKHTMQDTKTKGYKDIGQVMLETLSSNWCQINRGPRMYLTVRGRESQIAPAAASQGNTLYKIRNAKKKTKVPEERPRQTWNIYRKANKASHVSKGGSQVRCTSRSQSCAASQRVQPSCMISKAATSSSTSPCD